MLWLLILWLLWLILLLLYLNAKHELSILRTVDTCTRAEFHKVFFSGDGVIVEPGNEAKSMCVWRLHNTSFQ